MGKKVVHFEVIGKDGKKLQEFYGKLFEWKVDANNPMNYGMVNPEDSGLGGGISAGQGGENYVTVYAEVDDLSATLKKAQSLGGKTTMEPTVIPGGPEIAMFADPAGNIFGLIKAGSMG